MFKRKSIIMQWGLSYALILLIPLITIFVNYQYNTATIRREIMQAHELILENLRDSVDRLMNEEKEMFSDFYTNENLKSLAYAQTVNSEFSYDAYKFQRAFSAYGGSNKRTSYWLCLEETDFIIGSDAGSMSRRVYNAQKIISDNMPTYEEWRAFLMGDYTNEFLFFDGLYTVSPEKQLVYANNYFFNKTERANIFVTIHVSEIEELVKALPDDSLLTIYLNNSSENLENCLLVIDSEGVTQLPAEIDVDQVEGRQKTFDTSDYMVISARSDSSYAVYSLLVPQDIFWKESRHIRNVHFISLIITLFVGVGLMLFLLKRNFNPVSNLVSIMGVDNQNTNEFEQIEAAYGVIRQENNAMKRTIESQEKSQVSSYLLSMLKGRVTGIGNREQEMGLGLSFRTGAFALMGFYIPIKEDKNIELDDLSFFVLDNILRELMEGDTFYGIEDGRFMYYLFCIPTENVEKWKVKSLEMANFLCDFMEEKFDLNLSAAISAVEQDISQSKYMYQSVMEAFEYKKIIGGSGVITADELQEPDDTSQLHVCHVMLERALENGVYEGAQMASRQLFNDTENMPFIALQLRVLETFQVVSKIYNQYITDSVKRMQLLTWLELLLNADNAETMKQQFDDMIVFACAKINGQWEAENKGIVKTVKEYVEEQYTDSNLNISTIAGKMNRNPKYISKVFKEETGEAILDYINVLRIRKAQEILLTTNISIEEVGKMVGYASTRTFRRSFTKIVGTTPSGYLERN